MLEWWNSLTLFGQIYAAIAIPATIILVLQSLLLFLGLGFDHDTDFGGGDHDIGEGDHGFDGDDGLSLFTIRGLVAFFSIGGWTGLACELAGSGAILSILIAFGAGTIALVGIAILFKYSLTLQSQGNLDIHNALDKVGKVYIPIPGNRNGMGKISVMFQSKYTELDAVTEDKQSLKTGEMAKITAIIDEQTVLVTRKISNKEDSRKTSLNEIGGISK